MEREESVVKATAENSNFCCPACLGNVAKKLGTTEIFLLKILDLIRQGNFVKVNGYSFRVGKLSPIFEGLTGGKRALLGFECPVCTCAGGRQLVDRLIPQSL